MSSINTKQWKQVKYCFIFMEHLDIKHGDESHIYYAIVLEETIIFFVKTSVSLTNSNLVHIYI